MYILHLALIITVIVIIYVAGILGLRADPDGLVGGQEVNWEEGAPSQRKEDWGHEKS